MTLGKLLNLSDPKFPKTIILLVAVKMKQDKDKARGTMTCHIKEVMSFLLVLVLSPLSHSSLKIYDIYIYICRIYYCPFISIYYSG